LTVSRRRRIETWGGFALGLAITPLFLLVVASAVTALHEGLDPTGKYGVAIAATRHLGTALDRYRVRYHRVPDSKEGLAALTPEFIDEVPLDPWGHPYVYEPTGPDWADVVSYGADRRAGGNGVGADISARFGPQGSRPPGFLHPLTTVVIIGLAAGAAITASRRRWCASALAGMGAFWAVMLLAIVSPTARSVVPWLAFAGGLACMVGAIALLKELRYAPLVTLIAIGMAYLLLQYVVGK
jgi:general secretion pathway protein G